MSEKAIKDSKAISLKKHGTLNPQPENVKHALFQASDFFDPRDLVQVKYEMVRQVDIDNQPVATSARTFGFSRPSFYQAQNSFRREGLAGLVPRKRGPKRAHKLNPEVMAFILESQTALPAAGYGELSRLVQEKFSIRIHPRSIERRLLREKKQQ